MMRPDNQVRDSQMSKPKIDGADVPIDAAALQQGAKLHAEGRLDEAQAVYARLLNGHPQQAATAHYLMALLLTDRGDLEGALDHYAAAIALGAASADLFFKRAELLRRLDRGEAALENYDRALALQPDAKTFWNNRGVVLEALGRLDDALASHDEAIRLDPGYVQALHNRGSTLVKLQRLDEALASFDRAIGCDATIPETWNFHAVVLATQERYNEALTSADRALTLRPDYPEAHNNRSIALRALKRPDEALHAADAALAARPGFIEALNSRGSALAKLNRHQEACDTYRLALQSRPDDAAVQLNLGMALEALGDLDAAQAAYGAAEMLAPTLPDARFASGLTYIRAGDIRAGFQRYETRWSQKGGPRHGQADDALWLGEPPLGERTLLVHAEQGFGDVIQFCRFAPLAAPSSQLVLQVQTPLKRLLSSLDGVQAIYGSGEASPPFDVHVPIMSLPLALDLGLEDLTPVMPYLHASPVLVAGWRRRLPAASGLRIGLAWSGNPGHDNDHNRSMTLQMLAPLFGLGAQFVSLQKDYRPEDQAWLDGAPDILRFERDLGDFADTAALIACCDLVIAVDTAVGHLAGALGKPLWLMLPRFCDWRWMNERPDSPWYPSATLFRQPDFGDWTSVVSEVADLLKARTAER